MSKASNDVILYDLDNKEHVCWSPNTLKPRVVLAYKGIPYKTQWISYPDIDKEFREHGQQEKKTVTLPVLRDGEKYVADSWQIMKYLEEKVPLPTIFPGGIEAHEQFRKYLGTDVAPHVGPWIYYQIPPLLDDRGTEYFIRTREEAFGCPLKDVCKPDDQVLPALRGGLTPIFHALRKSEAFIMGKDFGMADVLVLGFMQWILRADKTKFDKVIALDADGNFSAWWDRCGQYMAQMD